jgi:hypothetical protein
MNASKVLKTLQQEHRNSSQHLSDTDKALIKFVCTYLKKVGYEGTLVRHVVYFLSHCGANLSQTAIAVITDRTDRNVRDIASMGTEDFRKSVTFSPKENAGRPPKIPNPIVPLITEFLLTHKVTSKREIIRFLAEEHNLSVCWDVLNRLLRQYELERLIQREPYQADVPEEAPPLFSGAPVLPVRG